MNMRNIVFRSLNIRLLAILAVCLVHANLLSAQETMSVSFHNIPLEQAITQLQSKCGCYFIYNSTLVNPDQKVSVNKTDASLSEILEALFKDTNIRFKVDDKQVILYIENLAEVSNIQAQPTGGTDSPEAAAVVRKTAIDQAQSVGSGTVSKSSVTRGVVKDQDGFPLPGTAITVKGTKKTTIANINGQFELQDVASNAVLVVSFLGFETLEVALNGQTNVEVLLKEDAKRLDEVVVIGNIERKRDSFTGATSMVTGASLKQVGSTNIVESLKSLDPSFVVLENTLAGANPNALPTIEVRGKTSINIADVDDVFRTDPNQPLFILDGFETSLQKIVDLDFNRVASVTLLKDAASTAFYGSRAANGVLVVETIKGEAGRFKFFYNGDYSVQVPDLTSYNMMNAAEKLEFERLSERYIYTGTVDHFRYQQELDQLYAHHLAEVSRGVNSYWMSEPLRTALTNRQSVRFSGGSRETTINIGASYRSAPGVMKGSKRETWGGDIDFTYNKGDFAITNRLSVSGYTGIESPYGSFETWARTNPYYRKTDENGDAPPFLDLVKRTDSYAAFSNMAYLVPNPLYNARLNNKDQSSGFDINERLQARWNFYKGMRLEGMFQLVTSSDNTVRFTSPQHTSYNNVEENLKGRYFNSAQRNWSYVANLMYVWSNQIGTHHYILNARGEIAHDKGEYTSWSATGFPIGTNGAPSFANSYTDDHPGYRYSIYRRANFLVSGNYAYDNRYLFDATYRLDGSTIFGSAKKFTPFWSTGIGWNMHEEGFVKNNIHWLTNFRLRATIGQTGNQNLRSVTTSSIYTYLAGGNVFGPAVGLTQLGNNYIDWQKTTQINLSLDINLFNSLFVGRFNVYQKYTDPLVVNVSQAPSTGATTYPMSLGNLTVRGFEFEGTYAVIRNTTKGINWRIKLMGSMVRSEYDGFSNKLAGMNKSQQNSQSLIRYMDGYSPNTLWAVRSIGIDPATGQEMFLTRNNEASFVYDPADIVAVGLSEPNVMGTIHSSFTYKQITLSVVLRYSLGQDIFNSALYNKVENISFNQIAYNQDKRALYDRWQNPGDIAEFKAITNTSTTPMSSRFIQTENFLSGESIGVTWRFDKNTWVRHLGMERLELNATAGGNYGIFRLSNIKRERGINYPEAYTVSLSVNAVF